MANRLFFFIALPGTVITFIVYCMVVFTPNYMRYTADSLTPDAPVGTQIQRHRVGFMQNCTRNYTMEKVDGKPEESKGKEECHVLDMQLLRGKMYLAFMFATSIAFFTILGALFVALVKMVLDWVPHEKIKKARMLLSRSAAVGLVAAHIVAGCFILLSTVLMILVWKYEYAKIHWRLGKNIFLGIIISILSFFTSMMWFMDLQKMSGSANSSSQ